MAKKDILLRDVSNPPLTTKGSALTFANLDNNFIELYNALVSLSQSSNIDAYDAAANYYLDDAVMESNQLYKCIVTGPITATTPSTNPASWVEIYATDLVEVPRNYKSYVATISQSGTESPVATVLQNDFSTDFAWSYSAVGNYILTNAGVFPDESKVMMLIGSTYNNTQTERIFTIYGDANSIWVETYSSGITPSDEVLYETAIEIRVYN